jgi:hypothetical protein
MVLGKLLPAKPSYSALLISQRLQVLGRLGNIWCETESDGTCQVQGVSSSIEVVEN